MTVKEDKPKVTEIYRGAYLVTTDTSYMLSDMFFRISEFYEGGKKIRGKYFTHEEARDSYAGRKGGFTYHEDWAGFNIPGYAVRKFFISFGSRLDKKERTLKSLLTGAIRGQMKFYVIGVAYPSDPTILTHEILHSLYHLNNGYRDAMNKHIDGLRKMEREAIFNSISKMGYENHLLKDEAHAYMSTEPPLSLRDEFFPEVTPPWESIVAMQRTASAQIDSLDIDIEKLCGIRG